MPILLALAALAYTPVAPQPPVTLQQMDVPQDKGQQQVLVQTRVFNRGEVGEWHTHHGVEVVYVASGQVTFDLGTDAPRYVRAGESITIPRGTVHRAFGTSKQPARLIITLIVEKGPPLREPAEPPKL